MKTEEVLSSQLLSLGVVDFANIYGDRRAME
jgi:hypothetical protein